MDKATFIQHFRLVLVHLHDVTSQLCFNRLSTNYRFIIAPAYTGIEPQDYLTNAENSYLKQWHALSGRELSFEQVVDVFYRDGKTPKWADCCVYTSTPDLTIVHILFSEQFRDESEIYYMERGTGPFKAVVAIPPLPRRIEKDGKFDVNWQKSGRSGVFTRLKRFLQKITGKSRRMEIWTWCAVCAGSLLYVSFFCVW